MKVAILETSHFQFALTQSEIFNDCEKIFITQLNIKSEMEEYTPELCNGKFFLIESIEKNEVDIINICKTEKIDLLLISPVFDSYHSLLKVVQKVDCKKVITTHNINTWFRGRFWSINSYLDRVNMRGVLKACDYISVEDFIYNHLKNHDPGLFKKYKFIYIPFTIFHENKEKKYQKESDILKIVLPGSIDNNRRRYEDILDVIDSLGKEGVNVTFSFAGRPIGDYGIQINQKLTGLNTLYPGIASFFTESTPPDMFRKEMETSDLVLSTSTKTFKGMGTTEYIGKTKPTAAIHDMISYELPGLLPAHLEIPRNLTGSVFNYKNSGELLSIIRSLIKDRETLSKWKWKAKENSRLFTAKEIRKGLQDLYTTHHEKTAI